MKNILFKLRSDKGLTQAQVAKKLDISQQAYQRYENAPITTISTKTLYRLADIFQTNIDVILSSIKRTNPNEEFTNALSFYSINSKIPQKIIDEEREKIISIINQLPYLDCVSVHAYILDLLDEKEKEDEYIKQFSNSVNNVIKDNSND